MKAKKLLTMLFALTCAVVFEATAERGRVTVKNVISAQIESSWQSLTDKCEIALPSRFLFKEQGISIRDYIRKGDPVSLSIGYGNDRQEAFSGFVADVSGSVPTVITCEDALYRLKRTPVNILLPSAGLSSLLDAIVPSDIPVEALDVQMGSFKANKTTVAKVLDKIKSKYGLVSYIKNGVLYCGKVHVNTGEPAGIFHFEKNIQDNRLSYRTEEEHPIKVTAISNKLDGSKIQTTIGDEDGEERTLNYFNIESKEELRKLAEADYEKLAISGYTGSYTAYGEPTVMQSDAVTIISTDYPERNGDYFVDAVKTIFNRGFSQEITLGKQV